jgi:short-subunit dehydrogenase
MSDDATGEFQGKVALVTGASSGIGYELSKKLTALGTRVALVARTESTLRRVAEELGPDRAAAFALDVSNLNELEALPARVQQHFGRLDIVVNNAGQNFRGPVMNHDPKDLASIITINLTAPIVLTRAAIPFVERGGHLIFIASIAGMVPVPGEATYSASKAGLRAFARAVAEDVEDRGIHAGCISPGPVDTGFFGDIGEVPDLVFSQPMSSAAEVADAIIACIQARVTEIAIPAPSGKLATLGYLFPAVARGIRPLLERRGRKSKIQYAERKASRGR